MAGADDSSGEKSQDPTAKKIEDARKKGDIAKSSDLTVAAVYLGFLTAIMVIGAAAVTSTADKLVPFIAFPDQLLDSVLGAGGVALSASMTSDVLLSLTPVFLLPFAAALISIVAQRGIVLAPSKIAPKLNRISPISGAKNKFGTSGMVEFLKTLVKMLVVTTTVSIYLWGKSDQIVGLTRSNPMTMATTMTEVLVELLIAICILALIVGVFDLIWQKYNHQKKLRMSFQEVKDEGKETEGDPQTKAQRRQRGRDIATNRMLLEVSKADVIVVNPTHFAVALKWSREAGSAPVCVAKGENEIALRIREIAMDSGIPIHSDPPTARAIHATVEIGHEIHPDHYHAIAAALRFAEAMRKKARERGAI